MIVTKQAAEKKFIISSYPRSIADATQKVINSFYGNKKPLTRREAIRKYVNTSDFFSLRYHIKAMIDFIYDVQEQKVVYEASTEEDQDDEVEISETQKAAKELVNYEDYTVPELYEMAKDIKGINAKTKKPDLIAALITKE